MGRGGGLDLTVGSAFNSDDAVEEIGSFFRVEEDAAADVVEIFLTAEVVDSLALEVDNEGW